MLVAGLILVASVVQTGAQDDGTFWCTHALHNVFRDTPMPSGEVSKLTLSGARGQTVGGQIVIRAGSAPSRVGGLRCSGLRTNDGRNAIPRSAFWSAFVEYCPVAKNSTHTPATELARQAPSDFPDAFSEATEVTIPKGVNQPIWVQFRIPVGAKPGTYSGMIEAEADGDPLEVPVVLTVYDFAMPADTRLLVTVWTNTGSLAKHQNVTEGSELWWGLVERVAGMMRAHHQNVILTPWSLIKATRSSDGKLQLDFTQFDRWVQVFRANGFKRIEVSHVGGREHGQWEDKNFVSYDMACAGVQEGQSDKAPIEEWLPLLQAHLKQRGWLDQTMIHVADEPIEVNLQSWKALSKRVRKAAPELRRIDAVHVPDLRGHLETWVPQLNFLEQWMPRFVEAQKDGVELWYYTAWVPQGRYPNRLMDYPLIKTRMLHWLNYTTGTTGYLHWGWNFWDVPFDQFAPGDNFIVWPGKRTPRSSLRYEAMREGIEDYEYLRLLEEALVAAARRAGAAKPDARAFVMKYAAALAPTLQDYSRDPARLYAVRNAVARSIETLRGPVPVAIRAVRVGGDAEIVGFAPPGCTISVGGARSAPGPDGVFDLVATGVKGEVQVTLEVGNDEITVKAPLIP